MVASVNRESIIAARAMASGEDQPLVQQKVNSKSKDGRLPPLAQKKGEKTADGSIKGLRTPGAGHSPWLT